MKCPRSTACRASLPVPAYRFRKAHQVGRMEGSEIRGRPLRIPETLIPDGGTAKRQSLHPGYELSGTGPPAHMAELKRTRPTLRRLVAPPRGKPAVEAFIPRRHVDQQP